MPKIKNSAEPVSALTSKQCIKCGESKPVSDYDVLNKTGTSRYCKRCRQKRQEKVQRRRTLKYRALKEKADRQVEALKKIQLENKIKQLQKEFNRFTLLNRNRLQVILRKCEGRSHITAKTKEAIKRRQLNQQRAEELLQYQITLVEAGIQPSNIVLLWRDRYGTNARKPCEELDKTHTR